MAVSLYAAAVHAIEIASGGMAKELNFGSPVRGWDGSDVWVLSADGKVSRGEVYWSTRVELRPLEDLPLEAEEEPCSISVVIRAKAWMPEDRRATWGRILASTSWQMSDFKDGLDEQDIREIILEWIYPEWMSAMEFAKGRAEDLAIVADQRRDVMDSDWVTESPI